ncbi:hypothetical protein KAR34_05670 [bacterium]|nr:hypothetical protein [bacterium]
MGLTKTPKNDTQVKSQIEMGIDEKPAGKSEVSDTTIFSVIIIGGLIGLFFSFFSA